MADSPPQCNYQQLGDCGWHCPDCGDITKPRKKKPNRDCVAPHITRPGIGDRVAYWLAQWGVTKERYSRARGGYRIVGGMNCVLVPMPPGDPGCGCNARKEWLNAMGRLLVNRLWP